MSTQSASPTRRRNKAILSCAFCRARKLRCDRQSPCGACTRRCKPAECIYSCTEQERKNAIDYRPHNRNRQVQQRIARLENLVTEMKDIVPSPAPESSNTVISSRDINDFRPLVEAYGDQIAKNMGSLSLTEDQAVYTGSTHWVTVLNEIRELKNELSEDYSESNTSFEPPPSDTGPPATRISLLNSAPCFTKEQILAMLPPRKVVDRHVSHFFNSFDMASFILNKNKFLVEYASFWENPRALPVMWIGLLLSMMSMSAFLQEQDVRALGSSTVESHDKLETYRSLTIHCLIAGGYLQASKYTIETLILHFSLDQNASADISIDSWILIGVIIRIALRMGLHRDPSHWPEIRPYQAELRRRLWIILYQMDFFTSTQVGLPRIIKDSQCDTRPPTHLLSNDLGFEHNEVPPERPFTESTPLLIILQRNAIIKVAAEIYDATEAGPPSATINASLSVKLEETIDMIPTWLKYKSLDTLVAENPAIILNQILLDVLVRKATYLFHRRDFVKGAAGEDSTKSNDICIKASLAILEHQQRISEETQPGGLMFDMRWKIAASLNHEFLQATMMLCFALSRPNDSPVHSSGMIRRDDILEALIRAKGIWEKNAEHSVEARRAVKAITGVIQQDLDKASTRTLVGSEVVFDEMPEVATQNYFDNFDYEQSMAWDPYVFTIDNDTMVFENMLDDTVTDQSYT